MTWTPQTLGERLAEEQEFERARAIANRERIRRLYLRGACELCKYLTCRCEELTDPSRQESEDECEHS